MAKYYGCIGYRETVETSPGIWEESIRDDRKYYGDVTRNYVRNTFSNNITTTNKSPECNNVISILADPYAYENFHNIVYAEFMGTKWTVNNVEVQTPRLILTLGGVYNDEQTDATQHFT